MSGRYLEWPQGGRRRGKEKKFEIYIKIINIITIYTHIYIHKSSFLPKKLYIIMMYKQAKKNTFFVERKKTIMFSHVSLKKRINM